MSIIKEIARRSKLCGVLASEEAVRVILFNYYDVVSDQLSLGHPLRLGDYGTVTLKYIPSGQSECDRTLPLFRFEGSVNSSLIGKVISNQRVSQYKLKPNDACYLRDKHGLS